LISAEWSEVLSAEEEQGKRPLTPAFSPEGEREKRARGKVNSPLTFRRFEAAGALESRGRIS